MRPSHPRRTPATPRPHAALRRAVAEVLENRTLLTTITGGDTFEFSASDDTWVRIVATGNITAEFIGASTGPAVGTTALRDLPGQFFAGPKAGQVSGGGLIFDFSATLPVDIYRIVITSSDANATLSVAAVEPLDPDEPGKARNAKPFDESVGAIRALNLDSDEVDDIDAPDGTGAVLIGTRVSDGTGNEEIVNTPILTATTSTAFGTVPAGTTLPPGITMLPGNEIGRLTIGGTITGTVDLGGSVDLFYAGWVITGNATGESSAFADPTIPDNFRVRGDVRNLIVKGGTGHTGLEVTDDEVKLTYNTGFDAEIDGEVGHFQSLDTFMGNVQVSNTPGVGSETRSTFEFERYQKDVEDDAGPAFEQGLLGNSATTDFRNDTLTTAQFLHAIGTDDARGFARVTGVLEADPITTTTPGDVADTYAIALMAGQTYTVQQTNPLLQVAVLDPDGRRVASDASRFGANVTRAFRFRADRPGIYGFQITDPVQPISHGDLPYTLTVTGVGNLAVGGVAARDQLLHAGSSALQDAAGSLVAGSADYTGFVSRFGDWGALYGEAGMYFVGGAPVFTTTGVDYSGADNIRVENGDLRAIDATTIGRLTPATATSPEIISLMPTIEVTRGDIGSLRSRTGIMAVSTAVIGGDMQLGDAAGLGFIRLSAQKGLGVFRAGEMTSEPPSVFRLNSDERGSDGILGLIDCRGDFGTPPGGGVAATSVNDFTTGYLDPSIAGTGGPNITTGQGGNVKYIRVGGAVYQDVFFASGFDPSARGSRQMFAAGEARSFRDDGGARVTLTPLGPLTANPLFNAADPASPQFFGPQLTAITYGIRGSGGVVLIDVGVAGTGSRGLRVDARGDRRGQSAAAIGTINVSGGGTAMTLDADGLPVLPGGSSRRLSFGTSSSRNRGPLQLDANGNPIRRSNNGSGGPLRLDANGNPIGGSRGAIGNATIPLDLIIDGSGAVDVFETLTTGAVTSIENRTAGTMSIISGGSIGRIYARGNVGVPDREIGVDLLGGTPFSSPATVSSTNYPIFQQRVGVQAVNIGEIVSDRSIGTVFATGAITRISANDDGRNTRDLFEGIDGAIQTGGNIGYVEIGEGIAPSGSGAMSRAGIYSGNILYGVRNQGTGSDVRGDIVAQNQIGDVLLRNGSIIGADILVVTDFAGASELAETGSLLFPIPSGDVQGRREASIRNISVTGNGGIIGSQIGGAVIDTIDVDNGFGIFTSEIVYVGPGEINRITADGYGLRYLFVSGGTRVNQIRANGNGQTISTNKFSRSVRQSERARAEDFGERFDPYSGAPLNLLNDIHAVLGTSNRRSTIRNVTIGGVMENVDVRGSRSLGRASAHTMRTRNLNQLPQQGVEFPMQFSFADRIGTISTSGLIDGLAITTGTLETFRPGSDVFRLSLNVAGVLRDLHIKGSLGGDSTVVASGRDGRIGRVRIDDNLDGTIRANSKIGSVRVNGRINGKVIVDNGSGGTNINEIRVGRGIAGGGLQIDGDIGKLHLDNGFGKAGDVVTINGDVRSLIANGTMRADLVVKGDLGRLQVDALDGDVDVGDNLGELLVKSKRSGNAVNGDVTVGGSLRRVRVDAGNVNGSVTAGGDIGTVDIKKGSLNAGKTLTSVQGDLGTVRISRDLFGTISAVDGRFSTIRIGRDVGNGTDPAGITAAEGGDLIVGRDVNASATVDVFGRLDLLRIGGDVESGGNVRANVIGSKDIEGRVEGSVAG